MCACITMLPGSFFYERISALFATPRMLSPPLTNTTHVGKRRIEKKNATNLTRHMTAYAYSGGGVTVTMLVTGARCRTLDAALHCL